MLEEPGVPVIYSRKGQHSHEIDVSRYGKSPWRELSPFCRAARLLPIPGLASYVDLQMAESFPEWWADSVEGIWQGLKRIDGQLAPQLFRGQPKKRRGRPEGHDFGEYRLLEYPEAKALIYIPAYLEQLRQLPHLLNMLREEGEPVAVVDVSYQPDVLGPKPISHAALLVDVLVGRLASYQTAHEELEEWSRRIDSAHEQGIDELVLDTLALLGKRVSELAGHPDLTGYDGCARLFLRENLMLSAIRCIGSHLELDTGCALLRRWLNDSLLEPEQATALSRRAPVCRWTEDWADLSV